ncbi:MAG: hypothetical protein ABR520_04110 [Mycobacteriales bacterium]
MDARRLVDTRVGRGAPQAPVGPGGLLTVRVAGTPESGVPATASRVVLNVTVVAPTRTTHLVVFPSGTARPETSSVNASAHTTAANAVTVRPSEAGDVTVYNAAGNTHVLVDVSGYYRDAAGAGFQSLQGRVVDTRDGTGGRRGRLGPRESIVVSLPSVSPGSDAVAIALHVTATSASAPTNLSVSRGDVTSTGTSNVNIAPDQTIANLVLTRVGADGAIRIYNAAGLVHVIADLVGVFAGPAIDANYTGDRGFVDTIPQRIIDTRKGIGPRRARAVSSQARRGRSSSRARTCREPAFARSS